ncbi:MAG: N-acetylmuramic acid 6-phosphate etherase [Myxococcales bacterium]|jgi:N-acetylmuramic acid 6-phosphate etherase|nr:N-acetylmuramic acid 6-phosphate etherase [Myxococcales bacterium]
MQEKRSTEAILDATRNLDRCSAAEILAAIHAEDAMAVSAVGVLLPQVEKAVDVLACTLGGGGRWINVGAGTSGRMGALDSAELPPTFGIEPSRVQAIVAGGARALSRAVEGAEDDVYAGPCELRRRGLGAGDAVVAISASGHTPFVLSCLEEAHSAGARTIAITCVQDSPLAEAAEIAIVTNTGAEVIAGSTRMKAGLAQKMVLHLLSTTVMVQLGYVKGNLMTHLVPGSQKLRERAIGILESTTQLNSEQAARLLDEHGGSVADALASLEKRITG